MKTVSLKKIFNNTLTRSVLLLQRQYWQGFITLLCLQLQNQQAPSLLLSFRPQHRQMRSGEILTTTSVVCMLLASLISPTAMATELGRLFTTTETRAQLDQLRNREPDKLSATLEIVLQPETPEPQEIILDPVSLRGTVQRNDGKNTVWVNDGNTFRGDLSLQDLDISSSATDGHILIRMPDQETEIRLRVGETFDPYDQQTIDIVPQLKKR